MKKSILISAFLILSTMSLMAQDRVFNYTYQSSVLNKGEKELEVWTTVLQGKKDYYREIQNRVEYEVGLGSNLQTSFYLNSKQKAYFDNVTGEIVMTPTEISISNEWKYKFSDPVANRIGFAGYAEFTVATDELEIELKAILDKKIGRTTHALNLTFEPEWETTTMDGKVVTATALKYDVNYGFAFEINKNWNLGAEIINRNVYIKDDSFTHSALFAGPTVAFNTDEFWVNLSVSPQIAGLKNPTTTTELNLDEFTKMDMRLVFSYSF
ncbi:MULTISPECIES: DUF6662 family protein [unclassified Flavobacterium]|jgi:hypothetical protein|uniref:DUF6662 family protein n=1 Tax=unclassified Flavobacterium TaxID=196869 RepID=UPI0025BEC446|nr:MULTISPECIES: DUF6662 family protein [unclassified Flavobacterium]